MFNPSQTDVRRFFCETFPIKYHAKELLTPLETIAADWIIEHPEYADDFRDLNAALEARLQCRVERPIRFAFIDASDNR